MHLTLETQRDTRGGNVVETLDIRISDTIGTRNYELFSGGEAFRINFALRIALSKMLARRGSENQETAQRERVGFRAAMNEQEARRHIQCSR